MSSETTRTIKYSPVADTLRFINRLQQAATPTDSSILRYNNLILGEASKANTRPFILYLPNGEPFKLATLPDSVFNPLHCLESKMSMKIVQRLERWLIIQMLTQIIVMMLEI